MKILITGTTGQLGKALVHTKPKEINNKSITLITPSRNQLDLSDQKQCKTLIENVNPSWIINSAAYTNVDQAETEIELAKSVNTRSVQLFSESLRKTNGKLLQISTDYVFDGTRNTPYKTFDIKNPINLYGRTKADAERIIEETLFPSNQGKTIRTSWLISPYGKNFVTSMIRLLNDLDELKVVSDQIGSPTSAINLANACWKLIKKTEEGHDLPNVFHYSDSGTASWYDLAICVCEFAELLGLIQNQATIVPIPSSSYPTAAKRPSYSVLECLSSKRVLELDHIHWRTSLKDIINQIANNKL